MYQMPPEEQQAAPLEETVMPLGVFAAGKTPREASFTSMFVQLDLAKDGTISGTYYNTATNEVHSISGSINKATQEAVWRVTDIANSPTMITGLYNLTQDAAIVEVHFPNGKIQSWTLVRLNK